MDAERLPDEYLFDLYRRYIGEPDGRTDVYLGFGLFLCGIGLAIVALALFVWSSTLEPRSPEYFAWAEHAYALGMLSLPATMLGIVVLLPSERRVLAASIGGVAIALVAIGGFYALYPKNWNFYSSSDADVAYSTVHVVAVYAIGLASITASTGAALIAHYLELARSVESVADDDETDAEHYSDEEIQGDIDAAMEDVELSWGGVSKTEHKRLSFKDHDLDGTTFDGNAKTTRSSGVDAQVAGLKGLKGGEKKTATSKSTVDDQTEKLKRLREQQRAEKLAERDPSTLGTYVGRLKNRLSGAVSAARKRVRRS